MRLCQGEMQLPVQLLTHISMLLVAYMLQLVFTCLECNVTCLQIMLWMAQAHLP